MTHSIGAIVIYGDFDNGETTEDGVAILPLDDSFDEEKVSRMKYTAQPERAVIQNST